VSRSRHIPKENSFNCCFPERDVQTIVTRVTGIGNPLEDILELSLEIEDESIPLIVILIRHIIEDKQVFLFGKSFGGLLVNRLCQEIHKCLSVAEYYKTFINKTDRSHYFTDMDISTLQRKLNKNGKLKNLIVAAFGSIYIPERTTHATINIFNYMFIGDVAIRSNYFELNELTPHHYQLDRNYLCERGRVLYKYNTPDIHHKVIFLNYYIVDKNNKSVPVDTESVTYSITTEDLKHQWSVHTAYEQIIDFLLDYPTNDISQLPNTCLKHDITRDDPYIVPGIVSLRQDTKGGKSKRKRKTKIIKKRKTIKKNICK